MSAGDSNIDEIGRWIERSFRDFHFTSSGRAGQVADDCAMAIATEIADSAETIQETVDHDEFPDNEDSYADFKADKYGRTGKSFGLRTGQMLSIESLRGTVTASQEWMRMEYGTGKPATTSKSGYLTAEDRTITDIEKAQYMIQSTSKPIDFYGIGEEAEEEIMEILYDALARHL